MGGDLGDRDGAVHDLTIRLSGGYIEDDIGIGLLINLNSRVVLLPQGLVTDPAL